MVHSTLLAWEIPWTEEPGGLQSHGSQSQTRFSDRTHVHTYCVEGNVGENRRGLQCGSGGWGSGSLECWWVGGEAAVPALQSRRKVGCVVGSCS